MAYNNRGERPDSPMKRRGGRRRKKVCVFCTSRTNLTNGTVIREGGGIFYTYSMVKYVAICYNSS